MKTFLSFFTFIVLATTSFVPAYAGGFSGGSTVFQQFAQIALETPTKFAAMSTAVSTGQDMLKNVILNPIANALINSALEGASNDILSWVSGGFGGSEPLIIGDPESYIRNSGLAAVRDSLSGIPTDSAFGDTIFNTILSRYKNTNDIDAALKNLSSSNIPSILQNNLCTDEKLTSLSLEVVADANGNYVPSELAAKKNELWNYACTGDPGTDSQLAARLQDLNDQNPSIGGWDAFLAIGGGENAFTRGEISKNLVAEKEALKSEFASKELFDGAGPVSEKECLKFDANVTQGQIAKCLQWLTVTPGDQVGTSLSTALDAGVNRLTNIMGDGSLTGMLTNFAVSAVTSGIRKALNSSSGSSYNLPVTLPSSRPIEQDLANDPTKKADNIKPMDKHLSYYLTTLNNLAAIDSKYMFDLQTYEAKIVALKDCSIASGYYTDRMSRITPTKNRIAAEQAKIIEAKTLISDTQAKLNASNSSQEHGQIFDAYLAAIDDRGLPTMQDEGFRDIEYQKNKQDVDTDTQLGTYQTQCAQQQPGTPIYQDPGGNNGNN